jgi:Xaa-Pro aminopeptidase
MPQEELESRLDTVRQEMARQSLDALVIYGDNYCFADLCYLTNYFPKVRGGIAVVPRSGPVSLLLNIGSRDIPFAKSLTWVDDVRASGQAGRDGAELLKEKGLGQARVGFVDSGRGFPLPQLEELKSALPQVEWQDTHEIFQPMRLRKSARELAAIRGAGRVLKEICDGARDLIKAERPAHEAMADIDRLARDKGVEDIRIMAGEKRLRPPSSKMATGIADHWAMYLAIQHDRYWVETGRTYILSENAKLQRAYHKAQGIVAEMAAQLKPGGSVAAIDQTARKQLGEFYATASMYGLGNGIGLNQWELPFLSEDEAHRMSSNPASLEQDMTVALRVVFETEGKLICFGDTFQATAGGAKSLVDKS